MNKKMTTTRSVFAVAALGLGLSLAGCSVNARLGEPAKAPEPAPVPPPAPMPVAEPAPPPVVAAPIMKKLRTTGRAKIEQGQIKIPGKLEFDVDKATIRNDAGSTEILTTLTEVLKENPNVNKVRIEGHTDNSGAQDRNRTLSKERADAVAKYLTDHGIDKGRIDTVGHGQDKALVPNDTPANKQINRRTEFHVVEVDGKPFVDAAATAAAGAAPAAAGAAAATPAPAAAAPKK